jgi:hypothetical protein
MIFLQLLIVVRLQCSAKARSNAVIKEAFVPSGGIALHDTSLLAAICAPLDVISVAADLPHLDLYCDEDVGCGHPKHHLSIAWNLLGRTGAFDCPSHVIVTLGHRSLQCHLSDKRGNRANVPTKPA